MRNSTRTILDKHEKAIRDTTAMIRLARLSNAIAFSMLAMSDNDRHPEAVKVRQTHHATFLLGGYLYEAAKVIEDLKPQYCRRVSFSDLWYLHNDLVNNHDVLAEMNFNIGYHHEADDRSTRKVLAKMELPLTELKRSAYATPHAMTYYPTAYDVDTKALFNSLSNRMSKDEVSKFVVHDLARIAERFLTASEKFIKETSRQLLTERNKNRDH